jgi:WD40 repeat protein
MKKINLILLLAVLFTALNLEAVVPRKWELRSKDDYLKGRLDGISVSYEGTLSLAPREDKMEGPSEDFYLSFILTEDGTSFLGTGHGGKVYKIGRDGKAELYFQAPEMDVTCLAMDKKGTLYAGTSPNGKIYKITAKDKQEKFFDPNEKYIWDLVFSDDGYLMAAVGESGGVYKISPSGDGQQILKAEENHILCLKKVDKGDLIAGSGGVGVVYRISSEGRTTVLFESPFEEIRSLTTDGEGNIYAAAGGSPSRTKKEEAPEPVTLGRISTEVVVSASAAAPTAASSAPVSVVSGQREPSALYRIRPDGAAKKLWESSDELIYTLFRKEAEKELVFGTGNKGRIYKIDKDEQASLALQGSSEQVYALIPSGPKVYVLANNPSRLTVLSPEQRFGGEYLSDVLDTKTISSWGRIVFDTAVPAGTSLQVQTRSGNSFEPNSMWSDWSPPIQKPEEQILSPKARYLQFKILFKTQSGNASPSLQRIGLFYLQTNVAPAIQKLEILPPNEVYIKPPEQDEVIWGLEDTTAAIGEKKKEEKSFYAPKKAERKGYQTVTWAAEDENEDDLVYALYIKKVEETSWRLLKDLLTDSPFAFDTLSFPDGNYLIKLEVSDLPSNPPGTELKAEKTSQPLVIDHSLPAISGFTAVKDKNTLAVAFQVEDAFSSIEKVEYLVRPGTWRVVFPVDGICDSKQESFKFTVALPPNADNHISVRVTDRHHNVGVFMQNY